MSRQIVRGGAALALVIVALVVIALVGSAFSVGTAQQTVSWPIATPPVRQAATTFLDSESVYSQIYNRVSPAVVSINVVATVGADTTLSEEGFVAGTGTGFVIDTQGHIVTNAHVVEGATRIEVNFFDGSIYRGELVGLDFDADIAVVRVDRPAAELQTVALGDSDGLFIGQEVVAIGSPFNQPWTMTTGIISALDRRIDGLGQFQIGEVIQTDAAINPGNSGGPLLNLAGEVVGVNSQIISESRSNSGIGFAVPANLVLRVASELIADGTVDYSYLGIRGGDVSLSLIEALNLPNNARGVVVSTVEPNGPAGRGGVRDASGETAVDGLQGFEIYTSVDIITAIDGQTVTGMASLIGYLASETRPGDTVTLTVIRNGQEQIDLPVTLTARPGLGN